MEDLFRELEKDEAAWLMYLSGELSSAEVEEIEQRLDADPQLRTRYEQFRDAHNAVSAAMLGIDDIDANSLAAANRAVSREIRSWTTKRLAGRISPVASVTVSRYPRWFVATSAAAVLAVGMLVWWGMRSSISTEEFVVNPKAIPQQAQPDDSVVQIDSFADLGNLAAEEKQLREIVSLRESVQ